VDDAALMGVLNGVARSGKESQSLLDRQVVLTSEIDDGEGFGCADCFLGPFGGIGVDCDCCDLDLDGDVDLLDFGALPAAMS
jgi:hypothetical protein